jgi:hypothetical protein
MIIGDVHKVNLGTQSFEDIITRGNLYIDKSGFIEHVLTNSSDVMLITRPRRLGKSLNMDMLRCFLTLEQDHRDLFRGLYIEQSSVWQEAHNHPVVYFDFKNLNAHNYKDKIYEQVMEQLLRWVDIGSLSEIHQSLIQDYMDRAGLASGGIAMLTYYVHLTTGKHCYVLIDEYDHLLMAEYQSPQYEEIREFMTHLLSAALKGNHSLAKGVLTGAMHLSDEEMTDDLNNVQNYDVFRDRRFSEDFGLTTSEVAELDRYLVESGESALDVDELMSWYSGISVSGTPIYTIYSVMYYIEMKEYDNYWQPSSVIQMIRRQLDDERLRELNALLQGESITTDMWDHVTVRQLAKNIDDASFYSLLVQTGYLAIAERISGPNWREKYSLVIPNKEIQMAWQDYILKPSLAPYINVEQKR